MNSAVDTIVAAKVVQNAQVGKSSAIVIPRKEMSTPALVTGLVFVCIGLIGIIVLAEYMNRKYKK